MKNKAPKKLTLKKQVDEIIDSFRDTLASGMGDEFTNWHERMLKKDFAKIKTDKLKQAVWEAYCSELAMDAFRDELEFMMELFGKKTITLRRN